MFFKRKSSRADMIIAYKEAFATDHGKKVLLDLMNSFHIFDSTMADTPEETAFKEGERSVVLRILKTINIDPEQLDKIVSEGQSKEY